MAQVLFATLLWTLVSGCGVSLTTDQNLNVLMTGVPVEPSEVSGDVTPKWESFILTGVSLLSEDASETIILFSGASPKEIKVVNRPQLAFTKVITDYSETTFSGLTVSFDQTVLAGSKNSEDHVFGLSSGDLTLTETFTVEPGKDIEVNVNVQWKNTVSGEVVQEPGLELTVEAT